MPEELIDFNAVKSQVQRYIQDKKFKKAEKLLKASIEKEANNESLRMLAELYRILKKSDKTIKVLKKLFSQSDYLLDKENYIFELVKAGQYETASQLKELINRNPKYHNELKKLFQENNPIVRSNQLFYKDFTLHQLKADLFKVAKEMITDQKELNQASWFTSHLFNKEEYAKSTTSLLHRPSYLYYPGITQAPFIDAKDVVDLESYQSEYLELVKLSVDLLNKHTTVPYVKDRAGVPASLKDLQGSDAWSSLVFLEADSLLLDDAKPLVDKIKKLFDVAHCSPMAPEMMLSVLKPGTKISPHYGISNIKQTLHIPIKLPEGDVAIKVGGLQQSWNTQAPLIFDDSFLHEAWNHAKFDRVVLIVDIWHPELTVQEKTFLSKALPKIDQWQKGSALK